MERIFFCGDCRKFFYSDCEPTVYLCTCSHCGSALTITCDLEKDIYNTYDNVEKNVFKNKIKEAYPNTESIMEEQNRYRQRIDQLEYEARTRREELIKAYKVTVTTGDIKQDYQIIGPVFYQISNRGSFYNGINKKLRTYRSDIATLYAAGSLPQQRAYFDWLAGNHVEGEDQHEIAFMIATLELKKRASRIGADAVIWMHQNMDIDPQNPNGFYLQMYGTAVKFR